jgi:hypothetical protein
MKSNQLRIGNLVMSDGYLYKVYHIPDDEDYFEECQSIPLTEEWLVKFGFESNNSTSNFLTYYNERYDYRIEIYQNGDVWFDELRKIQHVHQLQNLYFVLTGEELTLKENS